MPIVENRKLVIISSLDVLIFLLIICLLSKDLLCSPQDILGEQGGLVRVAVTVQELVLRYAKT